MSGFQAASPLTGRFVWHDLMTPDCRASADFYGRVFPEWTVEIDAGADRSDFCAVSINGVLMASLIETSRAAAMPAYWLGAIEVESCVAAVIRAEQCGGSCKLPTVDVPGIGRAAVIADRQGASVKLIQSLRSNQTPLSESNGCFCRDELLTNDVESARSFYQTVAGWSAVETLIPGSGPYTVFKAGSAEVARILALPEDAHGPPCWLPYLVADDIENRAALIEELGGTTWVEPQELPGSGDFSVHSDPLGACFALFRRLSKH